MVKAQAEQTQTVAADAVAEDGFMDTTAEQVAIMVKTVVQAVSGLAEAQVLGLFLRADRAQGAATVMPHYFIKRRKRVWH
jgi:hypothetical protein